MRHPDQFVQTFTGRLLTYATGRTLAYYDMPTVRRIVRNAADGNYRFSDIVLGIVQSDQFRLRRVPEAAAETTEITANNAR